MRKFFKYFFRTIGIIVVLLLLIVALLYVPGVQRYVKDKAVKYVETHWNIKAEIGKFSLKFPLDLTLEKVYAGKSTADTMAYIGSLHLDVGLGGIFRKQLSVRDLKIKEVKLNLENDTTGMELNIRAGELGLQADRVNLGEKRVDVDRLEIEDGDVYLKSGRKAEEDTTSASAFNWVFLIGQVRIENVYYSMTSETLPLLRAGIKWGEMNDGKVDIAGQQVRVGNIDLKSGECRIESADAPVPAKAVSEKPVDTTSLWTIQAGSVALENSGFSLVKADGKKFELTLTDIGIRVDSVYNRGTVVKADLSHMQMVRPQGGKIDDMRAEVDLENDRTDLSGVYIRTPNSTARMRARSATSLTEAGKRIPIYATLDASVGTEDIRIFWPEMPPSLSRKVVKVEADIAYREDKIDVRRMQAGMPGYFRLAVNGQLASFQNLKAVSGNLNLEGDFQDMSFTRTWLKGNFNLPDRLHLLAQVRAEKGNLFPRIKLCREEGCVTLSGNYDLPAVAYDLQLKAEHFNAGAFLPADSLGRVTAEASLNGQGYRLGKADARLTLEVDSLEFRRHTYRDIRLAADVKKARIDGLLKSGDPDLLLDVHFKADSVGKRYVAELDGKIENAALKALHLMQDDFTVALGFEIKGAMEAKDEYLLNADIRQVKLDNGKGFYSLGDLVLRLDSEPEKTQVNLVSGDFRLDFRSDTTITVLSAMLGNAVAEISRQVRERKLDMEKVQAFLPRYTLNVTGSVNNVMGRYLQAKGIRFKEVSLETASAGGKGVYIQADVIGPVMDKIRFDSVTFSLEQQQKGVKYRLQAVNPQGIVKDLYKVCLQGSVSDNRLEIAVRQQNKEGEIGVDIGTDLIFRDSSLTVSFFPVDPTLGYSKWMVNAGNQLTFYKDGAITADLRMAYQEKLISLQSLEDYGEEKKRLQIEINGIDLKAISNVIPFVPDLEGILNTDLLLYSLHDHMIAEGDLTVRDFYYRQQRIGDVGLDIHYSGTNRFTEHTVDFTLYLEGLRRAVAKGGFATSDRNRKVAVDVDIPSLPLYVINAFVPDNVLQLKGDLYGSVALRGSLDTLQLDGGVAFREAEAEVTMLGTGFRMDSAFIPIRNGKILFRNFRFTAPNGQALTVDGNVTLTPFSQMNTDLAFSATGFQVVNVKANPVSLVYGKAYMDLNAGIKGPFSNLKLTGNVKLLDNTSIHYVLRNSSPELKDRTVDLVRFVSFSDTTLLQQDALTNRVNTGSITMKLFIEIGNAVSVNVDLSESVDNQVSIQGGGNLIFSITPEEGNNLSGKYTLSGGTVRYSIPVVGEKNFTIQSGSYVEWTGAVDNPTFHITASESVRVSVTEDNQSSRLVTFNAMIVIQGNLRQPQITFDLSAPNDQAIQGQLAAFSSEERTKQAMNLLIYGTYSGPGTMNTGNNANNTLNNFVEKELNQWTRKYLKNSGLTFGIDSYNQIGAGGQEVKRTDYSYQFSKQLFNDKINVKIGGRISTDNDPGSSMEDNLVDDVAIEYMFTKNRNWFLKVFRHTNYESVLEGEVTQTGVGIVLRKSFRKVKDLFIRKSKRENRK